VSDGEQLLDRVQALRRRLLARAAMEGATRGATLGLAAVEAVALMARLTGAERTAAAWGQAVSLVGALLAGALVGGWVGGWRHRLSVEGAARLFDLHAASAGGPGAEPGNADRVRVAVSLASLVDDSRFAAAAVADGWRTVAALVPAAVAPSRWPPSMVALVALALAAGPLHVWSRPDGRWMSGDGAPPATTERPFAAGDRAALVAEAAREARALKGLAQTLGDEPLRALATRLERTLETLPMPGAQTAALKELLAAARAAADQARVAAIEARAGTGRATRPPGAAGDTGGPPPARADERRPETPRRLSGIEPPPSAAGSGQASPPGANPATESARRLERLGRDLDPPAAAAEAARGPATPAPGATQPGSDAARERLARAEEEVRRSLGTPRSGGDGLDRAGAESGSGTAPPSGLTDFERRAGGTGSGAAAAARRRQEAERAAGAAQGAGDGPAGSASGGGGGRGPRTAGTDVREPGQAVEIALDDGPGPSRAESIALGAGDGFADRGYHRTYRAYRAAVEQTLELTAVPDGRQQLVKRYFDLIRPRGH
jgi:hypothetical protein